jgi:hypothetical protein
MKAKTNENLMNQKSKTKNIIKVYVQAITQTH